MKKVGIIGAGSLLSATLNNGMEAKKQIGIAAHIGLEKPSVYEQLVAHVKEAKEKVYLIVDTEIENTDLRARLATLSVEHPNLIIVDSKDAKTLLGTEALKKEITLPYKNYRVPELASISLDYAEDFNKPTHRNSKQSRRDINRRGF